MDIHVNRNGQGFGPYEESEARSLYARGNIAETDWVWRDGMAEWQPARQFFGERAMLSGAPPIVPPHPFPAHQPPPVPGYVAPPSSYANQTARPEEKLPPKLHWALVLLFTVLSFGIFGVVWLFIQSSWIRTIDSRSNATMYLIGYVVLASIGAIVDASSESSDTQSLGWLLQIPSYVLFYCGYYSMRRSMLDHYNSVEPIRLNLSGAMTFFFSMLYLQHHMTRIAKWKETGNIKPQ
ncbi:DUF4339 domain-containing protein [Variovorax sp. 38R]|uniref:DUF4339 domain-containing protein n=1 Tax=Variovorax sp. 38R TaxID=2774875 RepID=UPI001780AF38|nr:DUF4339 domain-containing protein [Variovorax sp. 38R]QOF81584.1 DUF4339 domain-containing protein [Variovorax sp. 38R]